MHPPTTHFTFLVVEHSLSMPIDSEQWRTVTMSASAMYLAQSSPIWLFQRVILVSVSFTYGSLVAERKSDERAKVKGRAA